MLHVRNILFPTDLSERAENPFSYAVAIAQRFGAQLHVVHVRSTPSRAKSHTPDLLPHEPAAVEAYPAKPALKAPIQVEVVAPSVPVAILRYASEHDIDLIVMGGRSRSGLRMPRLGAIAGRVVRYSPCPVLTVRHRLPTRGLERILVPIDFSEPSRKTLTFARDIAALAHATIDLVHALDRFHEPTAFGLGAPTRLAPQIAGKWEAQLREFWDEVEGPQVPFLPHVIVGPPGPEIVNFALKRGSDLIVIGTHGKTGLRRLVMGSVAESVTQNALCATLSVRSFQNAPLDLEEVASESDAVLA
jgi:nucleotide-binding universal stress UspA family protein